MDAILSFAAMIVPLLAAILVATCAAVSPLFTSVETPNALNVPVVVMPRPVMAEASATSPRVLR